MGKFSFKKMSDVESDYGGAGGNDYDMENEVETSLMREEDPDERLADTNHIEVLPINGFIVSC